jgi:hypothetical protein
VVSERGIRNVAGHKFQVASGKVKSKREEGRGKREEGRGKREAKGVPVNRKSEMFQP